MRRAIVLPAALAVALSGCVAVAPTPTRVDTAAVVLDHVAVHVADLDRSVAFYQRVFQVQEIAAPGDPAVIRWLDLGDGASLHLIAFDGPVPPTNKAVHFAVRLADFDGFVGRLGPLAVAYSDWPGAASAISNRPDGVRQVYVQDPDSYWIEVNDATGA